MTRSTRNRDRTLGLLALLAVSLSGYAQTPAKAGHEVTVIEEVVVSARRENPPAVQSAELPPWQITEETRQKLGHRMQLGYDPALEQIHSNRAYIQTRGSMRETLPVTLVRLSF